MFPMGYYDYGYGLGFGMASVPPPAVVNHQADEHVYLAHEESGDTATIALLSFAALGSLAGLLIARKANKATKLVDAVTHDLRETAQKGADEILDAAKIEASKKRSRATKYADRVEGAARDKAQGITKTALDDAKAFEERLKALEEKRVAEVTELNGHIEGYKTKNADLDRAIAENKARQTQLSGLISENDAKQAELERLIAEQKKPASAPVADPIEAGVPDPKHVDTLKGYTQQDPKTAEVLNGTPRQIKKAVRNALRDAGEGSQAAVDLYNEGKYAEALPLFEKSVNGYELARQANKLEDAHIPFYAGSLHNAGLCHQMQGNYGNAIGYYDRALNVIPDNIDALLYKAECHVRLDNQEEALNCWTKAANAGDENSMLQVATIKFSQKSYKEAAEFYEKAAAKNNPDGYFGLAHLCENGLGRDADYLQALKLYKQSLELYIPMAEGNPAIVKRLDDLNDVLRPGNPKHWHACMGAKTPAEIDALSDPEKAIRNFINDEEMTVLLQKSKNIVEGKPVTEGAAVAANATDNVAGSAAKPVGQAVPTDAPTREFAPESLNAPPTLADALQGAADQLPTPNMGDAKLASTGAAAQDNLALAKTTAATGEMLPRLGADRSHFAGTPDEIEAAQRLQTTHVEGSQAAGAEPPVPVQPVEDADSALETLRGNQPLVAGEAPTLNPATQALNGEAAANAERAGEEQALNEMAAELDAHANSQVAEALTPEAANVAPQPEIADLPAAVQPKAAAIPNQNLSQTAVREPNAEVLQAERAAALETSEAAQTLPGQTQVSPEASSLNQTMFGQPSAEMLHKAGGSVPTHTQTGMNMFGKQTVVTGEEIVRPNEKMFETAAGATEAAPEAGTKAAETAELAEQAAEEAAEREAAEFLAKAGPLTKDAMKEFDSKRMEEGFFYLKGAIEENEPGSREVMLNIYDELFEDKEVARHIKEHYLPEAVDFMIDSAEKGSNELKVGLPSVLQQMYTERKLGGIDIPSDLLEKIENALAKLKRIKQGT